MTASGSKSTSAGPRWGMWAGIAVACVTGLFILIVVVLLAVTHVRTATDRLFESKEVDNMRAGLTEGSETFDADREALRQKDLEIRQLYQDRLTLARQGGWMILVASIILIGSVAFAASHRKRRPVRRPKPDEAAAKASLTRILGVVSVAVVLVLLVAGGAALKIKASGVPLEPSADDGQPAARTFPSPEEIAKQWSRFRGPQGSGIAADNGEYPTTWDAATGQNILWKTEVPMTGLSSPIIWGNRIYLTGALVQHQDPEDKASKIIADKRAVFCFDADTGNLLWQRSVETAAGKTAPPPKVSDENGYATPTPVTDGQGVYAMFPNGDVAGFAMDGKPLWTRSLGPLSNSYGFATGLEMYHNFLLIQLDQGLQGKTRSAVLALDAATGKTVWETRRNVPQSWATPILVHTDKGDQFVTCAKPVVVSYDPQTGKELWSAGVLEGEVAPSPVFVNNTIFVANASAELAALRVDGSGDVTESAVLWSGKDGMPDIASPLCDGRRVWLMTTEGRMTCYDAKDGKKLYEKEFSAPEGGDPLAFRSSPGMAGGRVYLMEDAGLTYILSAEDGKELSKGNVGEIVRSSLVFLNGRIYIRGEKHLFCIGTK
jgi:outer membrane protein assembly factor BamB